MTGDIQEIRRVISEETLALQALQSRLQEYDMVDCLQRACDLLFQAATILVSGVGKSGLIGQKIAATFTSTGSRSFFIHPTEALHGDIGIAKQGDVCLLLSKSGSTSELLALIPTIKKLRIPIIALVGMADSPIAHLSDISLDVSVAHEACPLGLAPMSSTTLALVIGDALAAAMMQRRAFTAERFAEVHAAGQLGKNLTLRVGDVMHFGNQAPQVKEGVGFREILSEITDKGLGCVAVVSSSGRLSGFITDGDIRRCLQHSENLDTLFTHHLMTATPIVTHPETLLGTALTQMEKREKQLSVLPVVDEYSNYLGIIRVHDIIRAEL